MAICNTTGGGDAAGVRLTAGDDSFGADRCASVPRDHRRCSFGREDSPACLARRRKPGDPFHIEAVLVELGLAHLRADAFSGTRHDRGHMAPQRDRLNQGIWAQLEAQVLFWGVTLGPIHVVTGPIWGRSPEEEFEISALAQVDRALMGPPDEPLRPGVEPRPVRPTGFFKVIYRPAAADEAAPAVAFLMPHTHQTGLSFWSFLATVAVVEGASGLVFGFDEQLKHGGGQGFWLERRMPGGWSGRAPEATCAGGYRAEGWFPQLSRAARRALCHTARFAPPPGPGAPE